MLIFSTLNLKKYRFGTDAVTIRHIYQFINFFVDGMYLSKSDKIPVRI